MRKFNKNIKLNMIIYSENDNSDYVARLIMSNLHAQKRRLIGIK